MAKIDRYGGNLLAFASAAVGTERTIFGEVTQANDLTSQVTADFLRGWGIVGPSDQPALEDFNALGYTLSQLLAYLHQAGVAEYDAAQEYFIGSITQFGSKLWMSRVASNIGNQPDTSPTQWAEMDAVSTDGIQGSHSNLRGSATGTTAIASITADSVCVKNSSGQQKVLNSVSISPSIAASGVNGLDTGVSAASTWYYVWVIWNGTTTAGLISLSSTAPTMPVGYTHKARVSEFRTDATGNKFPLKFTQSGNNFQWVLGGNVVNVPVIITGTAGSIAGSPAGWVAASVAAAVSPIATAISLFLGNSLNSGTAIAAPNALFGGVGGNPSTPLIISGGVSAPTCVAKRFLLESANVYYASNVVSATLNCLGWESNL